MRACFEKIAWFVQNFWKCNIPFIDVMFWNYCTRVSIQARVLQDCSSGINACLEALGVDVCIMKLSHGAVKVQIASDFTYFHNKPNGVFWDSLN